MFIVGHIATEVLNIVYCPIREQNRGNIYQQVEDSEVFGYTENMQFYYYILQFSTTEMHA